MFRRSQGEQFYVLRLAQGMDRAILVLNKTKKLFVLQLRVIFIILCPLRM